MNTYSLENVSNIFVLGSCNGDLKRCFDNIKNGLSIKDGDEDKPHPKEIERLARKAAKEQQMLDEIRRGMPHGIEAYNTRDAITTEQLYKTFKASKKSNKYNLYSNSVFIITGDCGIGIKQPKYYEELFDKFNNILSYNNSFIILIRGNYDDPAYFDGAKINFSNIKAVPDYSVISANGKNILCVGGAISIDRTWKIKQEERINRFSTDKKKNIYWEAERPVFNEGAIKELANMLNIDYVVSHSAPSFVMPELCFGFEEWSEYDKSLAEDIQSERKTLDKVFETLRDCNMKPKYWVYGHFNLSNIEKRSDTIFRSLQNGFCPILIETDIISFMQNEEEKKKKKTIKKAIKKMHESNDVHIEMPEIGREIRREEDNPFNDVEDFLDEFDIAGAVGDRRENAPEIIVNNAETREVYTERIRRGLDELIRNRRNEHTNPYALNALNATIPTFTTPVNAINVGPTVTFTNGI